MKSLDARIQKLEAAAKVAAASAKHQPKLRAQLTKNEWLAWVDAHHRAGTLTDRATAEQIASSRGTPAWSQFMADHTIEGSRKR